MKSNDINMNQSIAQALEGNDAQGLATALMNGANMAADEAVEAKIAEIVEATDRRILAERGKRQLTTEEREYYNALLGAMRSRDPKQAVSGIDKTFPQSIINTVFDELEEAHPLLSRIDFRPSSGNDVILYDKSGRQKAVWGELCDAISKELSAELASINAGLFKLSAFIYACKPGMELGADWLDAYIRQILYDALANGLEEAILIGDGDECPIGMCRQVGSGVTVVDGKYPAKDQIEITNFSMQTVGNLISMLAVNPDGKARRVRDLIMVVNDADYYSLVMPAATIMGPDGAYRSILPYDITIIPSANMPSGDAIFGMAYQYIATAGIGRDGRIEYSDEFAFLADKRTYLIKMYGNGQPKDANSFLYLDISGLVPPVYKVEAITPAPNDDATLLSLKIGSLTLTPSFDPTETSYTAATTAATNVVTAVPTDASATVVVMNGSTRIANGTAATWAAGENVVTIAVTAEDGTTTETYTVTVTKS